MLKDPPKIPPHTVGKNSDLTVLLEMLNSIGVDYVHRKPDRDNFFDNRDILGYHYVMVNGFNFGFDDLGRGISICRGEPSFTYKN